MFSRRICTLPSDKAFQFKKPWIYDGSFMWWERLVETVSHWQWSGQSYRSNARFFFWHISDLEVWLVSNWWHWNRCNDRLHGSQQLKLLIQARAIAMQVPIFKPLCPIWFQWLLEWKWFRCIMYVLEHDLQMHNEDGLCTPQTRSVSWKEEKKKRRKEEKKKRRKEERNQMTIFCYIIKTLSIFSLVTNGFTSNDKYTP